MVLPCSHSPHNLQVSPFHPTTTTSSCISELSTTNFISFVSVISRLSERSEILGNSRTLTVASEIMEFPICGWVGVESWRRSGVGRGTNQRFFSLSELVESQTHRISANFSQGIDKSPNFPEGSCVGGRGG